jgi:cation transport regulator ChaB
MEFNINTVMGLVFNSLLKKITIPTDYESRCLVIKSMLDDDCTGLVDSLTDFMVSAASVNFNIESENPTYSELLNKWLVDVNAGYSGQIPIGINELAKEYYKERWKGSSFPCLKIAKWEPVAGGFLLPTQMFFVDGSSIHAKEKESSNVVQLINYDYFLDPEGKFKLDKNVIFNKPYGRWFDKYPEQFLIKRGVYHNYKIIQLLKDKQGEILNEIQPYLLHIAKGSPDLVKANLKTGYTDDELKEVVKQFKDLKNRVEELKDTDAIRATNYDEVIKHLVPDISSMFDAKLTTTAERGILAGLGYIDVIDAVSSSRRESVLNPKAFIEETKEGIKGFKQVLKQLLYLINQKNIEHKKYANAVSRVTSSSVTAFATDDFKNQIRLLYERGGVSKQTYSELVGEVDYDVEKNRKKQEAIAGDNYLMYPPITKNDEEKGIDIIGNKPEDVDVNGDPIPVDKIDDKDAYNYSKVEDENLETAPYKDIKDLPANIKEKMSESIQKIFIKIWNETYKKSKNESYAFSVTWNQIKKITRLNKQGKYVKK